MCVNSNSKKRNAKARHKNGKVKKEVHKRGRGEKKKNVKAAGEKSMVIINEKKLAP